MAVAAGVALSIVALNRRSLPGLRTTLVATAICVAFAVCSVVLLAHTLASPPSGDLRCRDDVAATTFGGADQLRSGHNPYTSYDALRTAQAYGCAHIAATALRRGQFASATAAPSGPAVAAAVQAALHDPSRPEIERNLNYPSGSFLLGLVGPAAFPWVMALLLVGALALTVRRATTDRRAVALALAAQVALLALIPDGHTDAAVVAMLLIACASPTTLLGGLALGLACSTKQTAWFLVPTLLATAYARGGRRGLLRAGGGVAIGFGTLNLPFVFMGASAYIHGVMGPLVDGLFPLGVGPIGLVTSGVLPIQAAPLFTALMLCCVVASVPVALRWDRTHPGIGVLLGSLALFVGPRSLLEYIAGAGVLVVCATATAPREPLMSSAARENALNATIGANLRYPDPGSMSFSRYVPARPHARAAVNLMIAAGVTMSVLTLAAPHAAAAGRASIRVTPVRQAHNLDCEAAALQVALAAIGINVTQDSILANLGDDPRPPVDSMGRPSLWGNPYTGFVGAINGRMMATGYGVYGSPIAAAARAEGAAATAQEGVQPSALYAAVASGTPVVVWVSHLLAAPSLGQWTAWDGTAVWYSPQEHAQTLVGFDMGAGTVTLADPWDGQIHTFPMGLFESRFAAFHSTAVFVAPPDGPSAMVSSAHGGQAIFWRGADDRLWEAWNSGRGWSPSVQVSADAGPMASAPSVAITAAGQQIVFWQGTDGLLHEMWWQAGTWSGPVLVDSSAIMASPPAVLVTPSNQQAVLWEAPGGQLQEMWFQEGHWYGPVAIPGASGMSSPPSVIGAGGEQAVFWKGSDGNLAEAWWSPADRGWHGPVGVISGAAMGSGPAAAVLSSGQQIVFWQGTGRQLEESWWTPGSGWSGIASYSFGALSSTPSVDVDSAGRQTVFWTGSDANAWMVQWSPGRWSAPIDTRSGPIS
jgi:uncharacterized protein YvpB